MVHDDLAIAGDVDVQLDRIGPQTERLLERGQGVLEVPAGGSPMADPFYIPARGSSHESSPKSVPDSTLTVSGPTRLLSCE